MEDQGDDEPPARLQTVVLGQQVDEPVEVVDQ